MPCGGRSPSFYPSYYIGSSPSRKRKPFSRPLQALEGFGQWDSLHEAVPSSYPSDPISNSSDPPNLPLRLIWLPPLYS